MISLLRSEVRRFTSRRLMKILGIGALALLVLILGRVAMVHSDTVRTVSLQQECEEVKSRGQVPPDFDCSQQFVDQSTYEDDRRLHGRTALPTGMTATAVAVALLVFVMAASYVGADWHSGTLQALLFWEPRRGRVLAAKAIAAVTCAVGFLVVMEVVTYLGTWLIAATRGTTAGVTAGLHTSNLLLLGRAAVFVSFVALLGYAIAGLSRFTAAALGVAFVYFAIVENLVYGLRPGWERFLVSRNVGAVLAKEVQVFPASRRRIDFFDGSEQFFTLTGVRGAVTLGIYLAILLGAYWFVFTRRDVT